MSVLVAANLLSSFTRGLLVPVMPLFLLARGFTFFQLAWVFSAVTLSGVAVQLLAGRYRAFFGRHSVILVLLFVSVILFPAYLFATSPGQFLLISAATSFAGAAAGPGLQAILAEATESAQRARVFAYLGSASSFSYAAALIVSGFLLPLGFEVVFYVGALVALASFCVTSGFLLQARPGWWRPQAVGTEAPRDRRAGWSVLEDAREESGALRGELRTRMQRVLGLVPTPRQAVKNVNWASVHLFLFGVALTIYPVYFPIYLQQRGLPLAWLGLVIASSWITYGIFQPLGARYVERTGRYRPLIVGSLLAVAALNFVMATGNLALIVVAWVLIGIADGLGRPVTYAYISNNVTRSALGTAFGRTGAASTLANVVGPLIVAVAVVASTMQTALALVTMAIGLAAVPLWFIRPIAPPPAAALPPQPRGDPA